MLGIPFILSESSRLKIHNEQLLLEGFWDNLKSIPTKMQKLMLAVQTMSSDPTRINGYLSFITQSVSEKLKIIQDFINKMKKFSEVNPAFQKIIETLTTAVNVPITKWQELQSGWWKGTVGLGVIVILNMIVKKLTQMGWETLGAPELLESIGEYLWEKIKELAGEQIISGLLDAASLGVSRFVKILIDTVGNVTDIFEPLEPVLDLIKDSKGKVVLSKAAKNLGITEIKR